MCDIAGTTDDFSLATNGDFQTSDTVPQRFRTEIVTKGRQIAIRSRLPTLSASSVPAFDLTVKS